jgi:hypothetical protein
MNKTKLNILQRHQTFSAFSENFIHEEIMSRLNSGNAFFFEWGGTYVTRY